MRRKRTTTITVLKPRVKPIKKRGKNYIYKVNKLKGCFILKKSTLDGLATFRKVKCP